MDSIVDSRLPVLPTERLLLRPLEARDAPAILALRSDERVNRYLDRPPMQEIEAAAAFIAGINAGGGPYWAVCLREAPELAGTVCLWNFSEDKKTAELGYELRPAFQGKGIMHEAVAAVVQFGFQTLDLHRITAVTHGQNEPSKRVLEKHGFSPYPSAERTEDGCLEYQLLRPQSVPKSG